MSFLCNENLLLKICFYNKIGLWYNTCAASGRVKSFQQIYWR
jgi:hypothetical protein